MKISEFFRSLLAADGEISSKRFAGLLLVVFFMAGGIVGIIHDSMSEVVESILKTGLYTGVGLLGVNAAESIVAIVKRQPVVVKEVKDDDEG